MNNYVIGVNLKGQNVVMKEFNAIKKTGEKLAKKKINVNVGAKVSASGSGTSKSTGAARTEAKQLAKVQGKAFAEYTTHAQNGAGKVSGGLQNAMTGGTSGIAASLPGIGAIFSAAQSSIEAAAQEFVAGVTATKNIRLVENNFKRAFGGAMDGAFDNSMFSARQNKAVYANLAEQGVKTSTLADRGNVDLLDQFARAQGVGSLEELFQRMQSGQLKEGGGLGKGEIEFLKSSSQMLNNRYSAETGMQTILQTLKSRKTAIAEIAGTGNMGSLARSVRSEGNIQTAEQNFSSGGASDAGYRAYQTGMSNRVADRADRMRFQRAAQVINGAMRRGTTAAMTTVDRATSGRSRTGRADSDFLMELVMPSAPDADGAPAPGGGADVGGSESGGAGPTSQSNSDLTRAGSALANTLNQINTQLMAVQYQMRTRGD